MIPSTHSFLFLTPPAPKHITYSNSLSHTLPIFPFPNPNQKNIKITKQYFFKSFDAEEEWEGSEYDEEDNEEAIIFGYLDEGNLQLPSKGAWVVLLVLGVCWCVCLVGCLLCISSKASDSFFRSASPPHHQPPPPSHTHHHYHPTTQRPNNQSRRGGRGARHRDGGGRQAAQQQGRARGG